MPIGPYGGAPGFRSPAMRSPKPALGDMGSGGPASVGGGAPSPAPRPMRPPGTQMFSGGAPTGFAPQGKAAALAGQGNGMRLPSSFAGTTVTPYERYMGTNPTDRMNQKEFWQSGQAPQYAASSMLRTALGLEAPQHPLLADALRQKRRQQPGMMGRPNVGGRMAIPSAPFTPPVRGNSPNPEPRLIGPPASLDRGVMDLDRSVPGATTLALPMPPWVSSTPPTIQPMPPVSFGQDPRLTVLR